jgi:Ca-activated chloride channel family protein
MLAEDNKPSRIVRARLKIQDLLTQRKDGLTALVVYSGEAHIVTPLTDDTRTIINLLPTLTPGLLPIPGSNVEMAMSLSKQLITDSGLSEASIVLFTDSIDQSAIKDIKKTIDKKLDFYLVGVGTEKGAPIPTSIQNKKEFLRDANNNIVIAKRDTAILQSLADSVNGYYLPLQANESDIRFIVQKIEQASQKNDQASIKTERRMDLWDELGPTLILFCLPFLALMFRRGWLLITVISLTPAFMPEPAYALSWDDLWLNKNQRAQKAFSEENYTQAEQDFSDSQWQGSAAYKNKNYQAALDAFSQGDSASDDYNKGNALSQLGQYDDAIAAYNSALQKAPTLEDAKNNKRLVEAVKKQQEQQQDQKNDSSDNEQDSQQPQDSEQQDSNNTSSSDKENQQQNSPEENSEDPENKEPSTSTDKTQKEENAQAKKENEAKKNESKQDINNSEDTKNEALSHLSEEEKQELEQWIRKVPDDPSGLLKRKFEYEFQKRRQLYQNGQWQLPENNAHKRY